MQIEYIICVFVDFFHGVYFRWDMFLNVCLFSEVRGRFGCLWNVLRVVALAFHVGVSTCDYLRRWIVACG